MRRKFLLITALIVCLLLSGCGGSGESGESQGTRDNTSKVLTPSADGTEVYSNGDISIDASNSCEGYVMVRASSGDDNIVKIKDPEESEYTYYLKPGEYQVLPLSSGNGKYQIQVLEGIGDNSYVMAYSAGIDATISDEFKPFLYPNQYAYFDEKSTAVTKAAELAEGASDDLDVIEQVYSYVISNIEYDTEKAKNVSAGYLPDVDATLADGSGICFDYASVMTAMLRSQGIPTKLEVGYAGEAYHAWISTYIDEIGWVDNVIQFDGESWSLIDPTLAANNDKDSVKNYVGDGSNYYVKYSY